MYLNPIQMRGGKDPLPPSFFPVTFFSLAQIIELEPRPPPLPPPKKSVLSGQILIKLRL